MGVRETERRFPMTRRFERRLLAAATARTADFTSDEFGVEGYDSIVVFAKVSAASGTTPTLDLHLQTTYDNGDNWVDIAASPQLTAAHGTGVGTVIAGGSTKTTFDVPAASTDGTATAASRKNWPLGDVCRVKGKVGGTTPSFTVKLDYVGRRD